jgi:hypothetical protein
MLEESLTAGERFWLWSRRRCLRPRKIAELFDVPIALVRAWLRDRSTPPRIYLGGIDLGEQCAIYRRRAGLSIRDLSLRTGFARSKISEEERGKRKLKRLKEFWYGRSS